MPPKKKKSGKKKLAKMTEEERLIYLEQKRLAEEEMKKKKEDMLTQFLKVSLFVTFNFTTRFTFKLYFLKTFNFSQEHKITSYTFGSLICRISLPKKRKVLNSI